MHSFNSIRVSIHPTLKARPAPPARLRLGRWPALLWLGLLFLGLTAACMARATVVVSCDKTTKQGDVTLEFFICADAKCLHGVKCTVTVKDIPADTSGVEKARKIERAIKNSKCAKGLTVTRNGATVTVTDPNGNGVVCDKATDSTGEKMRVTSDGESVETAYVCRGKLHGTPSAGEATLGFNGIVHTVSTAGKTLPQIYAEWQAAFGEGEVTLDGLTLPPRFGFPRSFYFEVTDPGLVIEVTQSDPAHSVPPELVSLGRNHFAGVVARGLGAFDFTGGGSDAWDNFDECSFACEPITGDFDVRVRVEGLQGNSRWTKAGLMVRESLSESARMVFNRVTPPPVPTSDGDLGANDSRFAYRTGRDETALGGGANGGRHEDGSGAPDYPNAWLRIERVGSVISGYRSTDGVNWLLQGSQDTATWAGGALPRTVYVGLAVSKGPSGGPAAMAQFREFSLWQPPTEGPFSILSASSEGNPNGVKVVFGQSLEPDWTNLWRWSITLGSLTNAEFGDSLDTVFLAPVAPLVEGRTYTLTFTPNADNDARWPDFLTVSFVHGAGYEARRIRLERWNFIPGGSVEPILASQAYARDLPDLIYSNSLFEDTTPDANDLFSGRIFGVLNITNTGFYRFFACSDDSSRLYLSTDDQPANKVEIAREPEWNGPRQYATTDRRGAGRANASAPIRLEAGKRYWLEHVFADGSQGNNASVAWQPPGAPEPGNGALPIPESAFVRARYFKGTIFYTLGKPVFIEDPMSQTVSNGQVATFAVRVDGTPPYAYQWQLGSGAGFEDIPGATNARYAHLASWWDLDKPISTRCRVSNPFSSATSAVATLTVLGCDLHVTQEPADATVFAGQSATFSVGATGTPAPATYQWQQSGQGSDVFTNIPPATSAMLTLTATTIDNGTRFRCLVGNGCTNVVSAPATLTVLPSPVQHDFSAEGLSLAPLGGGVYEVRPQVGIAAGTDALTNPLPLDFLVLVNGVVRHDGRGANTLARSPCDDEDNCAGACSVAVDGEHRIGRCQGARGNCGCHVSTALAALLLPLSAGDVVQLVLDPDERVAEWEEANNRFTISVPPAPPAHDFAALGWSLTPLAAGLYEAAPQVQVSIGAGATSQVPLDFLLTVNGELRFDGRGAEMIGLPPDLGVCPDSECLNKLCYVATRSGRKEGTCSSDCLCTATVTLAAVPLALSPGDVVQLILDPDHRVPELDEGNNTFTLTVPNHPPMLAPIPNQAVHAGTLIQFTLQAHDLDMKQTLSFALEGGPDGAAIDPATGEFRWQTTAAHIGTSNLVVVRVSDNGQPALSAFQDFIISVAPPPVIVASALTNDCWQLTWTAVPGNTYRIEATSDLSSGEWVEQVGNLSAQDTVASWCLPMPAAHAHLYFRIAVVAALDAPVLTTAASAVTNQPAWTCCERNIQFPKTVKIEAGATTGLTNNNTRRFVTVDLTLPLEYNCANVPDQKCLADLAAKVVFRPRQDDGTGQHTQDPEEEMLITIVKTPEEAPDCVPVRKPHTMKLTIRWRGTYRATRHVKGTLNLELSVPGAKGDVNHKLDVDVESGHNPPKANNPVLKKVE